MINPESYSETKRDFLEMKLLPKIALNRESLLLESAKRAHKVRTSTSKGVRTSFRVLWEFSQEEKIVPPRGGEHSESMKSSLASLSALLLVCFVHAEKLQVFIGTGSKETEGIIS